MIERIYFISNSNIPKYEVIRYFLNVFGDSLILTFSSFLLLLRDAFKKKIAYNETFAYLGGRGSKKF